MNSHNSLQPYQRDNSKKSLSMYELYELRKNQQLFHKLVDTAIIIERHQSRGSIYEFNFSIKYPTLFGELIFVTGNPDYLGNWNPMKGIQLEWEDGFWKGGVIVAESKIDDFEYKYVCLKADGLVWEEGKNRLCMVSNGIGMQSCISVIMQDTWQFT